jgi:hypothetical protein
MTIILQEKKKSYNITETPNVFPNKIAIFLLKSLLVSSGAN